MKRKHGCAPLPGRRQRRFASFGQACGSLAYTTWCGRIWSPKCALRKPQPRRCSRLHPRSRRPRRSKSSARPSLACAREVPRAALPGAEVPPEAAPSPPAEPAWSRRRFTEDRALGAFEEVLLAWIQRLPIAGERWQSAIFIEQRMLSGIDALAALGPAALEHLDTLTLGNPTCTPAH